MSPRSKEANQLVLDLRREQFITAAFKIFACRGYAATRISDIASAAGLSHGLVYHYFKTKEDIFTELVEEAASIFLAVTNFGSGYDASPLDKIRIIAEMMIAMSYSAQSAYYLNILEQAHISEGISSDAQKIVAENMTSCILLIQAIIREGQELGQIVQDDPQRLALAYYSMVRGMTGIQSKIDALPGFPSSFSDAGIIVRSLKAPEYKEPLHISSMQADLFAPLKPFQKLLVYRTRINERGDSIVHSEKVTKTERKGNEVFRIETEQETGERMVALIRAADLLPIRIEFFVGSKRASRSIVYGDDRVFIRNPERGVQKEFRMSGRYYDNYTVPYILQSFPFDNPAKVSLILIMDGIFGWPVGPFGVAVQNVGREMVTVPAGEYDCYKLQLCNPAFEKSKVHYWYPVEAPSCYIRREISGSVTELVEIR